MLGKRVKKLEELIDSKSTPYTNELPEEKFIFLDSEDLPEGHFRVEFPALPERLC